MTSDVATAAVPGRRPTLGDIARRASVSTPTVSKVLNGHSDISPETRLRVQRVVDELGYIRRPARGPVAPTSIEVMVDQLVSPYANEILAGITLAAENLDVDVVVSRFTRTASGAGRLSPDAWARRLSQRGRAGAIVLTAELSREHLDGLGQEHLPVVVIDPLDHTGAEVPSVGSTNWAGGYAATEHLLQLGHRRIGALGGRRESVAAAARIHGFRAACASAGVAVDESLVEFVGFDFESGLSAAAKWLARPDRPTAIVAASDTQALGIAAAAGSIGLRIPHELSVVGYDDTAVAAWAAPALTTVRQPLQEMGRVALRNLLELAAGRALDAPHLEVATQLVVRDSTAPPVAPPTETKAPAL